MEEGLRVAEIEGCGIIECIVEEDGTESFYIGSHKLFPVINLPDFDAEDYDKHEPKFDDISGIDPGDDRLYPNISPAYYDAVKHLVNPHDRRPYYESPLHIHGSDPDHNEKPIYNDNITTVMSRGELLGLEQQFHVVSILNESGCEYLTRIGADAAADDRIQPCHVLLKGKYVVVVCMFAPTRWSDPNCRSLCQFRNVSQLLSQADNFEMLIVPKMRKGCEGNESAFNKFVSAFHGRLVVPFEHGLARDKICRLLNFDGTVQAVVVDTTGNNDKVVQYGVDDIVTNFNYPYRSKNGANLRYLTPDWIAPPLYTQTHFTSSLPDLLDTTYGDPTLRLHSLWCEKKNITVGQLCNKLVGVYLYQVGDRLDSILKVYNQCREKGLHFEIVVVCRPLFSSIDPLVFCDVAVKLLQSLVPPARLGGCCPTMAPRTETSSD